MILQDKGFLATELRYMHETVGLEIENFWGGTAGSWNRDTFKLDEMEIMVVSVIE